MLTLNDGRNELWQWDTGRKLTVDAECSQVHFSNKVFGRSIDVDVVDRMAIIPDILLQTDKELTSWAFVGTPENGYTKISKVFKVNRRNKPADYVFTPPEQTTLGELVERLEKIEETQDPDAIKNAVDDYLASNPIQIDEKDPTVPDWAKKPTKPSYNAKEVGALPSNTVIPVVPEALPNPNTLTLTGAVSATYDGSKAVSVEIPSGGGGGESEWRYIGEFTAADNINPWTIDADADGNPFACREFRILGSLSFFQLSSNSSANRSISFRGDDGRWYEISIANIQNAMFPLTKADSVDGVEFDTSKVPVTMDFNSHGGILIMECAYDQYNNSGPTLLANSMRNRGVVHTADKFTAVKFSLGYATNLVVAGSWMKIWGR